MTHQVTTTIDLLHNVLWRYIDSWRVDHTGPWWEADLSVDIGCRLREGFGTQGSITVEKLPGFLRSWPPKTHFRRLGTDNPFPMKPGRGMRPDHFFRRPGTDGCEWILELKSWNLDGSRDRKNQVEACIERFEKDATKDWRSVSNYVFAFLAVNIPAQFGAKKRRHTYTSDEFLEALTEKLKNSNPLRKLTGDRGDVCAVVKKIDAEAAGAELVHCVATPRFRLSSHRPESIECEAFAHG